MMKEVQNLLSLGLKFDLSFYNLARALHKYFDYLLWMHDEAALAELLSQQQALWTRMERLLTPQDIAFTFLHLYRAVDEVRVLLRQGQDPSVFLAAGRAAQSACGPSFPPFQRAECRRLASMLELLSADLAEKHGQSGRAYLKQAVAEARQALALSPLETDHREQLARTLLRLAEVENASPALASEGVKLTTELCGCPGWSEAYALRGRFYLLQVKTSRNAQDRLALVRKAHEDFAQAVKKNPLLTQVYADSIVRANALANESPRRASDGDRLPIRAWQ